MPSKFPSSALQIDSPVSSASLGPSPPYSGSWCESFVQAGADPTRHLPGRRHYLQSPYYFMCCSLYDANDDQQVPVPPSQALAGTLVSSLHRLKDVDNTGKS